MRSPRSSQWPQRLPSLTTGHLLLQEPLGVFSREGPRAGAGSDGVVRFGLGGWWDEDSFGPHETCLMLHILGLDPHLFLRNPPLCLLLSGVLRRWGGRVGRDGKFPASSKAGFRCSRFPSCFFLPIIYSFNKHSISALYGAWPRGTVSLPPRACALDTSVRGLGLLGLAGPPESGDTCLPAILGTTQPAPPGHFTSPTKAQKPTSLLINVLERAFPALPFVKVHEKPDHMQPKAGGGSCPSLTRGQPFVLFRPSTDWTRPTHAGKSNRPPSGRQFDRSFRLKTALQTRRNDVRPNVLWPVTLTITLPAGTFQARCTHWGAGAGNL